MNIPGSFGELALFVLFVLPGITFSTVRIALGGWRAPDFGVGARILEALFVSAIFDSAYLLLLGEYLVQQFSETENLLSLVSTFNVFSTLLLLLGIPAALAVLVTLRLRSERFVTKSGNNWFRLRSLRTYSSIPQAWDFAVLKAGGQFVRVRTEAGVYFGGWYAKRSLASTYPHDRDIFIESQWKLDKDGRFLEKIIDTAGVWIPITDKTIVEWINPPASEKKEDTNV